MKRKNNGLVLVPPVTPPEQCFTRLEPELAAQEELLPVRVNVPELVSRLLAAMPVLQEQRQDLVRTFLKFDVQRLDTLADYAWCLLHADCLYRAVTTVPRRSKTLLTEAMQLRYFLRKKAQIIDRDLETEGLARLQGIGSHAAVAADLELLHAWLGERRSLVRVPERKMIRAASIVPSLRRIVAAQDPQSPLALAAFDRRARAYTLLWWVYNEIRHAIVYLRHDTRDGNEIAPKLFPDRPRKVAIAPLIPINRPRRRKESSD